MTKPHGLLTVLGLNVWGGRQSQLLPFLVEQSKSVDVFCLQEVFDARQDFDDVKHLPIDIDLYKHLQELLPDYQVFRSERQDGGESLVLLVRNTIHVRDVSETYVYRHHNAMIDGNPSTLGVNLQYATVDIAGRALTIAHTHGYWARDEGEDTLPRQEQTTKLLQFIESLTTPVLVCGDFNTNPRTQSIARITAKLRNLVTEHKIPTTRPSLSPWHGTIADYLFVSPELVVKDFQVIDTDASDHLPLRVTIRLTI